LKLKDKGEIVYYFLSAHSQLDVSVPNFREGLLEMKISGPERHINFSIELRGIVVNPISLTLN
jgi:hypothetical protein